MEVYCGNLTSMNRIGMVGLPMYDGVLSRSVADAFYADVVKHLETENIPLKTSDSLALTHHLRYRHKKT